MVFKEKIGVQSVRFALTALASSMLIASYAEAQVIAESVQKIEITGSNIKRTEKEGTSPIQTITAKEIRDSGATTVAQLMKTVTAMGTGINTDLASGSGFAKGVATASLRGLGSSSTLILLNGRRMTPSAYADPNNGNSTLYDLNSIPLSAIERVEIFKDGASAVYGSDAIGGVINFITKRDYQGGEIAANISANDDQHFGNKNVNAFVGFGDFKNDGFNVFLAADLSKRDAVSRKEGVNDIEQGLYGTINNRLMRYDGSSIAGSNSSVSNQPFFYRERAPAGSGAVVTGATVVNKTGCDSSRLITGGPAYNISSGTLFNRQFCVYDTNDNAQEQGAGQDASLLSRATFKLNDSVTAYFEGAYTKSERKYTGNSPTIDGNAGPITNFTSSSLADPFLAFLPVGHPDNPFTNVRSSVRYRFENIAGGSETTNEGIRLLAGLKGEIKGFDWDTAVLWNRSSRTENQYGMLYLPTLRKLITDNRTLASLAADPTISKTVVNDGKAEIFQWDAKASTEFGKLGGGAIGFAAGVEFRQEKLGITPDPDNAAGNIYGLANTVINSSRNVGSAFVELRTPFTQNFEMDFAGRYDKYANIKGNFVPKVGAKWTVNDAVAFRGTYTEGFRAPALSQIAPGGAQYFVSGITDPVRCPNGNDPAPGADDADCNKSVSGTGGANPALKPETSKSYSIGMILSPTKNFDITVDFYKIRKEGEVILTDSQYSVNHESDNPSSITRNNSAGNLLLDVNGNAIPNSGPLLAVKSPWINQGSTETSGMDIDLKLRTDLGSSGMLVTGFQTTYVISYRRAEHEGDAESNVVGSNGGISDWATSGGDIPRIKASLSASWTKEAHNVYGSMNFVDAISLLRRTDNQDTYPAPYCYYGSGQPSTAYQLGGLPKYTTYFPDCKVASWTTVNLGYNYTGIKNLTLGLNIVNAFDKKAPYDPRYATVGYNSTLHNNTGRYWTLSARYQFK